MYSIQRTRIRLGEIVDRLWTEKVIEVNSLQPYETLQRNSREDGISITSGNRLQLSRISDSNLSIPSPGSCGGAGGVTVATIENFACHRKAENNGPPIDVGRFGC